MVFKAVPINLDKPQLWKADIIKSVDMYNAWFIDFAPKTFRETRKQATKDVEATLVATNNLRDIQPAVLKKHPEALPTLRMSTCPPIAVDRLVGLAGVSKNLVGCMEEGTIPSQMSTEKLDVDLKKIGAIIQRMADPDIFVWLERGETPDATQIHRAATIVADRLCGAVSNPIVRNAQEKRQLTTIGRWLDARGYKAAPAGAKHTTLAPGTYSFRMNVPVKLEGGTVINIPIDAAIMPKTAKPGDLPLFIEAKSAGDFTNVNKRRKEEAVKMSQLRTTYGANVRFNLFLCGYFDSGYLGYEASEGIDWVWEHRVADLASFGL